MLLSSQVYLVTQTNSKLNSFWQEYNELKYANVETSANSAIYNITLHNKKGVWDSVISNIREHHNNKLIIIITDDLLIHKKAVLLKTFRNYPILIIRWWDKPAHVKKGILNDFVYNKKVAANLYLDRELERINSATVAKLLRIENPVHLDQNHLWGDKGKFKAFRHLLDSLIYPNRVDELGNSKRNFGHIRLTVATHFYFNQDNIDTVINLLQRYSSYPKEVLDHVQFVLVDDGSPIKYQIPKFDLNLTWLKINKDVSWNMPAARNLALTFSRSNNVLITDLDHHFPAHTLAWLAKRNISHKRFYKLYCKYQDGHIGKGHPNIFYLSRARFFELNGVDEEFSGSWGCEDVYFGKHYKYHGTVQRYLPKKYYSEQTTVDLDKSYHSLFRDQTWNIGAYARKRMEGEYFGKDFGHSKNMLDFSYSKLADSHRLTPTPVINKSWKRLWLFRQLKNIIFK